MPFKKATFRDYFNLQGGRPIIKQDDSTSLWHIVHSYREDCPEVVTHISPEQRGTVVINRVEFQVAYLWNFEGKPCEQRSLEVGGHGYTRHGGIEKE